MPVRRDATGRLSTEAAPKEAHIEVPGNDRQESPIASCAQIPNKERYMKPKGDDRRQIEERIEQLVHDNPTLSATGARTLDSKTEPPSVSGEVLEEYYFLRDIVA
jgi:hypothetical protein